MKNKLNNILLLFFTCLLLTACKNKPVSITIAHLNDTHSHFDEQLIQIKLPDIASNLVNTYGYVGGYPRIATKVQTLRQDANTNDRGFFLLHAGDAFTGTLFFTRYKGGLNADFMNYMGFDAMVIGNHEFDRGNDVLSNFADDIEFPLLSANVETEEDDPLHGKYLPFTVEVYDGQPIAIVGITTVFTGLISSPSEETRFKDEIDVSKETVKTIKELGINKIIFLTHAGLDLDRKLAESVEGIDVIIGGHSHSLLGDHSNIGLGDRGPSPILMTGPSGQDVCIMQSGEHSLALGVTNIDFDAFGEVENCTANNVFLFGDVFAQGTPPVPVDVSTMGVISNYISSSDNIEVVEQDHYAQSMLDIAKSEVELFAATEIGSVESPFYHVRLPGDSHPVAGIMPFGSSVAPHVAESMAYKLSTLTGEIYVAVMNAGGVRSDLTGMITVGDAYTVLPYASTLVSMKLSGKNIKKALQSNVANAYGISGVAFPYVANIQYTVDLSIPGQPTVVDIEVKSAEGMYEPLIDEMQYNLVTTSYLAGGGDLYSFEGATDFTDTGHIDAEVFSEYVQSRAGSILTPTEPNITIVGQ